MKWLCLIVPLAGCAQMLGLDNTKFEQHDARVDAPSVCDGAPRCTATTGRSVCGQLFTTGDGAGQPLRVASPTGMTCSQLASTEGPCALAITGQGTASYFAGTTTDRIAGEIDDCGRFVVPDVDASLADLAVAVTGTGFIDAATILHGRMTAMGTDLGLEVPVVTTTTENAWGAQADSGNPPDLVGAYLVTYRNMNGLAISGEEIRLNGGPVGMPPAVPWGRYFGGSAPFQMIDPALTTTQDSGTALVMPATGSFMLGGFRQGRTCTQVSLQRVSTAIVHVTLGC